MAVFLLDQYFLQVGSVPNSLEEVRAIFGGHTLFGFTLSLPQGKKDEFSLYTTEEQYIVYNGIIDSLYPKLRAMVLKLHGVKIKHFFEFNDNGYLHVHGMIEIDSVISEVAACMSLVNDIAKKIFRSTATKYRRYQKFNISKSSSKYTRYRSPMVQVQYMHTSEEALRWYNYITKLLHITNGNRR